MRVVKGAAITVKPDVKSAPKHLSRSEVASLLGITYQRVCQLHRQGKLSPVSSTTKGPFHFRREDVERLRDARSGSNGNIAAAAFDIFEKGGGAVEVVKQLRISPDKAIALLNMYALASERVLLKKTTLEEIQKLGFSVTTETVPDAVARMLAGYRAASAIVRREGFTAELDARLTAFHTQSGIRESVRAEQ